jgi:hypothetical protein
MTQAVIDGHRQMSPRSFDKERDRTSLDFFPELPVNPVRHRGFAEGVIVRAFIYQVIPNEP